MRELFDKITEGIKSEWIEYADDGLDADLTTTVDTGSYAFNALVSGSIYGGIPGNRIMAIAGDPSTGKTMFALNFVKSFLDKNPDGFCVYFDTESAITTEMLTQRGIDTSRVIVIGIAMIEEFRHQSLSNQTLRTHPYSLNSS